MIGERIRLARKRAGMTQEELADALGVKRSVVSKYESDVISMRVDQLIKISELLQVRCSHLLGEEEHKVT